MAEQISKKTISFLNSLDWDFWLEDGVPHIKSSITGCHCSGDFTYEFINDLIEENSESFSDSLDYITFEEFLNLEKIEIICESPLELNYQGDFFTGECALFLISFLEDEYRKKKNIEVKR